MDSLNLFIVGTGPSAEVGPDLRDVLADVGGYHVPAPSRGCAWNVTGPGVAAAGIHDGVDDPGRYLHQAEHTVVAVDGSGVSTTPGAPTLSAAWAAANWPDLMTLHGRFCAVRICSRSGAVSLRVDSFGLSQVYHASAGGTRWFSNSVALLQAVLDGPPVLDLDAAAHMQALGWVTGARTLDARIEVLPAGCAVDVDGRDGFRLMTSAGPREALRRGRPPTTESDVQDLARSLSVMVAAAATDSSRLDCPLTAGRDSRLLAAIADSAGLRPSYYTWGEPDDDDVVVARRLAERFGWSHEVRARGDEDVAEHWESARRRVILTGDGLVSLRHVTVPDDMHARVTVLSGAGGELARANYATPGTVLRSPRGPQVAAALTHRLVAGNQGLVTRQALDVATGYISDYVAEAVDAGMAPFDVFELFYADERVRRWAATVMRSDPPGAENFPPFCTRPYIDVSFRATRRQRFGEWVGHTLMESLAPQLLEEAYERPWRSPTRRGAVADLAQRVRKQQLRRLRRRLRGPAAPSHRVRWRKQRRSNWFESLREPIRQQCLDETTSELWTVVHRPTFERLTSDRVDAEGRLSVIDGLLDAVTLFSYRHGTDGPWARPGPKERP